MNIGISQIAGHAIRANDKAFYIQLASDDHFFPVVLRYRDKLFLGTEMSFFRKFFFKEK